MKKLCSVQGCNRPHLARSWCRIHYGRWERNGDPNNFLYDTQHEDTCSVWKCDGVYYARGVCKKHYDHRRVRNNFQRRLAVNLRIRLHHAVKRGQKAGSAVGDLGCSIAAFKLYIENQFESKMTWDNYGEWHLDHIIPLASFDLTERQQFLEACNWLNYQPLWANDNISKGAS